MSKIIAYPGDYAIKGCTYESFGRHLRATNMDVTLPHYPWETVGFRCWRANP